MYLGLYTHHLDLFLHVHLVLSLCVCFHVHISLFYKDAGHLGLGAYLLQYDLILTNYIYTVPISKLGFILRYWVQGLQHYF